MMKNVLLLMGRGIEGTGNTRITIELEEYLKSAGYNAWTVAASDKDWGRIKSQENDIQLHEFSKEPYTLTEGQVKPDVCVIMSVPAKRKIPAKVKANPEELEKFNKEQIALCEGFTKTLEMFKASGTKIVYLQVDHKIHSIQRNYYAMEEYTARFFRVLDRIISHNLKNDFFTKFISKKVMPIEGLTFDVKEQLLISCDFDTESSLIGFQEKIPGLCYFIGRSARWKGWREFREFHYNYLNKGNFIAMIEGIELSINGKEDLYNKENGKFTTVREDNIVYIGNRETTSEVVINDIKVDRTKYEHIPAMVFGPYTRREAMNRVAQSKFGMFFTFVGEDYSGPIENTFLEIVAAGTVPVIRKELWDSAQFNGDRLTNYKPGDIGVLVYDSEKPQECMDAMRVLDYSKEMYQTYMNRVTAFCKANFDRKVILKRVADLLDIA